MNMQIILFRKTVNTYDYARNTDILRLIRYRIWSKRVRFIQFVHGPIPLRIHSRAERTIGYRILSVLYLQYGIWSCVKRWLRSLSLQL